MKNRGDPANDGDYLTTREAAELLGVALRTAQLWVEAGTLRAWKTAGGHRRITRESVNALLARQAAAKSGTPEAAVASRVYHVLVVDDDAFMREILVSTIRSWNLPLTVSSAEDGFAALLHIGGTRTDLLLADLVMPGMDGYRMIRYLRAMPEARLIDIIAISAKDPEEVARDGMLPSDVPLLGKPVDFERLEGLVAQRMAARR
ncbi:MAG: response regulator [Rhodocyclales bacterium]|nr:response regulator [Rhodocyclales bacterium]